MTATFDDILTEVAVVCRPGTDPRQFRNLLRLVTIRSLTRLSLFQAGNSFVRTCMVGPDGLVDLDEGAIVVLDVAYGDIGEKPAIGPAGNFLNADPCQFRWSGGVLRVIEDKPYPSLVTVHYRGLDTDESGEAVVDFQFSQGLALLTQAELYRHTMHPALPPMAGWERMQRKQQAEKEGWSSLVAARAEYRYDEMRRVAIKYLGKRGK